MLHFDLANKLKENEIKKMMKMKEKQKQKKKAKARPFSLRLTWHRHHMNTPEKFNEPFGKKDHKNDSSVKTNKEQDEDDEEEESRRNNAATLCTNFIITKKKWCLKCYEIRRK